MMKKIFILYFLLTFFGAGNVFSQGFLTTQGKAIVNEQGDTIILRAMGLGGWMLQEGYMLQTSGFANAQYEIRNKIEELIGTVATDEFYDLWLNNHVQKEDIDSLKSWGFNSVRLPMHYKLYTLPIEEEAVSGENTWLTKGFELTDSLISWCKSNEMYVLLDLHGAPGGQGYEGAISDYDPSKPSLWESKANRDKTVALWKKLAERYVDEPWVMGYDLINETNWDLPGGQLLRTLFKEITDSIRTVDNKHMIFIEGNWFANDFTGLTPPWDDNLVYSPHKYWSKNETADIQWVLTIRDNYNVPLYFSESGENSNPWFRDAIHLLEGEGLGWAWWPMKKVESISGPLSIVKTPEYQQLLDYWNGSGPKPSVEVAKTTLFEFAENTKIENCTYQKDVIDAMFRQVHSDETIPYNIQEVPGIVYASDFSMGRNGIAYFDLDAYDYHVTTGNFTAWNSGWALRNDAVDIEQITDSNSNGYAVGWIGQQEWMKYDINVAEDGVYDVEVRIASDASGGKFHLESKGARISIDKILPSTGGWYTWKNYTVPNVILSKNDKEFEFHVDNSGFNLSTIKFIKKSETTELQTNYLSAFTQDKNTINLIINKELASPIPSTPAGFSIEVNGLEVPVLNVQLDPENSRIVIIDINHILKSTENIRISYDGEQINAIDGTLLQKFSNRFVSNTIENYQPVPGKIEAEDYHYQLGIQVENCSDTGGGQNIGYLDSGDYLDYFIDVEKSGEYNVEYRTASESNIGKIELQLVNQDGSTTTLHSGAFPPTGGWQSWRSDNKKAVLPEGKHKIRLLITSSQFNINWFDFTFLTSTQENISKDDIQIFPNPYGNQFWIEKPEPNGGYHSIEIIDVKGNIIYKRSNVLLNERKKIELDADIPEGIYYIKFTDSHKNISLKKTIKN